MQNETKTNIIRLIVSILIPQAAGAIGAMLTLPSVSSWYAGLNKPPFNPPDWIFGPVWTALYLLMGISLYFAWKKGLHRKDVKTAVILFALQLLLNVAWTYLFFYLHKPLTAFVEIIVLWLCIAGTMISLFRVSTRAGVLFIPYLIWVSFASVLNFFLWRLNT